MIKLLIVDDHEMVRLGLTSYFSVLEDIEVIGEAENGAEGVKMALKDYPDVILMDLVMDTMDGIEATEVILKEWPEAKILILTSFLDDEKVYPAMEAGASGYLLKTSSASDIAKAIRRTYSGEAIIEEAVSEKLEEIEKNGDRRRLHEDLTSRELEVLHLIADGLSNQEIADKLFITLKTVKTHVSNILSKLEVSDRTQATIYAFKHGLIN
ncbi:two-component system, NarL family, response regulator LiaR [Atopostipes suicloacalis DSM 15692]|uniref:Two-component system, NarL family, response regulator LiaR n=1 Tax=Atopostipes suicloacalis DSM 15692 TaxID=1121025 RepID=A0A1M4W027_9LACT|nr:response regulator transcription factor [Atopostipes suicloacalis]SHE74588.1 two-component system, NarL family, response regulator LiaR [Atopostipes suicloacalis DSM 15692]